jgi:hypothetical protein
MWSLSCIAPLGAVVAPLVFGGDSVASADSQPPPGNNDTHTNINVDINNNTNVNNGCAPDDINCAP